MRLREWFVFHTGLLLLLNQLRALVLGPSSAEADELLDCHLKGAAYAGGGVASPWVKLHLGDPGAAGATNPAVETDRAQITFGNSSGGAAANTTAATWTAVSTTEAYTHYSLWTASTAGTFLGSGTISGGSVQAGNNFEIPIGDFDITLTPAS
jgi:hypothetical protein